MKGKINTQYGEIQVDLDVIARYAGSAAVECFGIVGMASVNMKDGIVRKLKKDSMTKGVGVAVKGDHLELSFHVIVAYGVSISAVCSNLAENVQYKLESFTGMKVSRITVYVEGVRVID